MSLVLSKHFCFINWAELEEKQEIIVALDWFSRKTGDKKKTGEKQEAGKMKSKKQETPVKNRRLDGYAVSNFLLRQY